MRFLLMSSVLALGLAGPALAQAPVFPPVPPAQVEGPPPPRPSPRLVWEPGHWNWNPGFQRYDWVRGHWREPPRGRRFAQGYWRGGLWVPPDWH